MALLKFLKGNYSSLSTKAITEGQVLICGDTGEMFVDVAADKRVKIGDFVVVSTVEALETLDATVVPTSRLYYVEDGNILARSNGTGWVQINKQKNLAELGGVSATTYATDKAALVQADTNNATAISDLETYVGTFTHETAKTVVEYINAKTDGIATSGNLEALGTRVTAAEGEIDALQAAIGEGGSVTVAIADAKKAGTDAATAVTALENGQVNTNKEAIEAINNETTGILAQAKGYADGKDTAIAAAKSAADAAQADVDALEAKVGTVADGKTVVGLIGTAQAAADAAQSDVDALEAKVGTVPADKTVVQMIADAQTAATYDDTQIKADIKANADAITVLNGTGDGSVSKQVADAVAQIVADAPEAYDTLKEISDWISSHASDAATMNSQINTNKADIANLTALVGALPEGAASTTVVGYIDEAIAALKIGDYAKAADLTAAVARISTAEGKITTLEGQVATINGDASTDGSIAKAAADTLASAKAYTDGKDTAMDTRVDALEAASHTHSNKALLDTYTQTEENLDDAVAKKHEHTNKTVLDGITAEKVSAWDSAESNAKSYTDTLANGQVATNKTNIENLQSGKADKATTLAGYGIANAYTKDEVQELLTWGEF